MSPRVPVRASTAVNNTPHLLCGGDCNGILQEGLDSQNLKAKNEWQWHSDRILPVNAARRTLVDIFRSLNPHTKAFRRFPSEAHPSGNRLQLLLCNFKALETFTPRSCSIEEFGKTSDHHPVVARMETLVYRKLNQEEKKTFSTKFKECDEWASAILPHFNKLSHETKVEAIHKFMMAVSDAFHNITSSHTHKPTKKDKCLVTVRENIPNATDNVFKEKMEHLQQLIDELQQEKTSKGNKQLHRNLVRGVKLKRTLSEGLAPSNPGPAAIYSSNTHKETTSDGATMHTHGVPVVVEVSCWVSESDRKDSFAKFAPHACMVSYNQPQLLNNNVLRGVWGGCPRS